MYNQRMAYHRTIIFCPSCERSKEKVVVSGFGWFTASSERQEALCENCQAVQDEDERIAHFTNLDSKTTEERIRLIEEQIYNIEPTHVSEPQF